MKKDIVIYTAISGNYDSLKEPKIVSDKCDYVCFTDKPLKSKVWQLRKFDETLSDNTRTSRRVKILPHKYFSEYKYSVWIDANIVIKRDIISLIYNLFFKKKEKMALFRHPSKRSSIIDEVNRCIILKKDGKEIMQEQVRNYFNAGFPNIVNEFPATFILFRKHNENKLKLVMEDWWEEVSRYSKRDQLSLPFVLWKHNFGVYLIDQNPIFLNYFKLKSHKASNHCEFLKNFVKDTVREIKDYKFTQT
jgi:hypothetical protein